MKQNVSVLIPAFNEEEKIYATVQAVQSIPSVQEIIVIDDASKDGTTEQAKAAGAKVITLATNVGKGGALNRGLQEFTGEILVMLDGDLGSTAAEAGKLIEPILAGEADMTIARFPKAKKKGGFGLVKGLAHQGIKAFTGLEMWSPLSGQRAMTRAVVSAIGTFASGYGVEVGLTIDVARRGFRVREVPVNMTHSETGRDIKGFQHRGKQFVHVAKILLGKLVTR